MDSEEKMNKIDNFFNNLTSEEFDRVLVDAGIIEYVKLEECQYCKDFKEEEMDIKIAQLCVDGSYYDYECPLNYCPSCGEKIK